MKPLHELGAALLVLPQPGAVTDFTLARLLETTSPNVTNAWTHVVPALEKYAKCVGRRSIFGRDKGAMAYHKLEESLSLAVLGLYGDRLLSPGASSEDCLLALVRSLVLFKDAYPNWPKAYSAGYDVFVKGHDNIIHILSSHQRSVEAELF
jgi:hypothetical protein